MHLNVNERVIRIAICANENADRIQTDRTLKFRLLEASAVLSIRMSTKDGEERTSGFDDRQDTALD